MCTPSLIGKCQTRDIYSLETLETQESLKLQLPSRAVQITANTDGIYSSLSATSHRVICGVVEASKTKKSPMQISDTQTNSGDQSYIVIPAH